MSSVVDVDSYPVVLSTLSTYQMSISWPTSRNWLSSKPRTLSGIMTPQNLTTACWVAAWMSLQQSGHWRSRFVVTVAFFYPIKPICYIQLSGPRIQKFDSIQIECGFTTPLKITLHNNTRWGSAFGMLDRAYKLRAVSLSSMPFPCALVYQSIGHQFIHLVC